MNTGLNELILILKNELSKFDNRISDIDVKYGTERVGDIPHSLASIEKAKKMLGYNPEYDIKKGLNKAINWYWNYLS